MDDVTRASRGSLVYNIRNLFDSQQKRGFWFHGYVSDRPLVLSLYLIPCHVFQSIAKLARELCPSTRAAVLTLAAIDCSRFFETSAVPRKPRPIIIFTLPRTVAAWPLYFNRATRFALAIESVSCLAPRSMLFHFLRYAMQPQRKDIETPLFKAISNIVASEIPLINPF